MRIIIPKNKNWYIKIVSSIIKFNKILLDIITNQII